MQGKNYDCYEIIDDLHNYGHLKCGRIKDGEDEYLLRCGKHMVQLWKLRVKASENEKQDYQLVYIKPYTNSVYRSFYLSPNIWRLETFKSIKYLGGTRPRIILNIVEDDKFLSKEERKDNLTTYTEEFILPLPRNNNVFDNHCFEGACRALYYLNIYFIEKNDLFLSKTDMDERYQVPLIISTMNFILL